MKKARYQHRRNQPPPERISSWLILVAALPLLIETIGLVDPSHAEVETMGTATPRANGQKVYLSAAYHTSVPGARGECSPGGIRRSERGMGRKLGDGMRSILAKWGYGVKVGQGDPSTNRAASNAWGSTVHMPLHSNAGSPAGTCGNRSGSSRGMWQIYRDGEEHPLASYFVSHVAAPGTNDRACAITGCTVFSCLEELCSVSAKRKTYSETDFHD
jgi:hypothetical protein